MSSEFVVEVSSLAKRYEVYGHPSDRLKQMLMTRMRRLFRLPDKDYFREFWALRNISLTVRKGETVAIIGQNGSGKSTLLQLVCGTLSPSLGNIQVHGRIAALLELGAGFNPEFTGRENVYLSGLLYGIDRDELAERYDSIVAFAEVDEFIDEPVKTYSSGMYVRLAFAIAAHMDADVLVVDEALSVGDVRFTQKCMRFLREFQKKGTLLFVSHDVSAVMALCSRAVWLDHGHLRMDGNAKQTVEAYLAAQHAQDRESQGDSVAVSGALAIASHEVVPVDVQDARWEPLRDSGALGRVHIFEFDEARNGSEFGAGRAKINRVTLRDDQGAVLSVIQGGEVARLQISAVLTESLDGLIFGFYLKDRLGQRLFGDNTFMTYAHKPVAALSGTTLTATFRFRMPVLPVGAYSFDIAIASGTQDDHTQEHWIHDAMELRATDTSMRHGLIGIPMLSITVEADNHA
jgi:lipopolysaccharide transport system ATP-binding protein